MKLKKKKRILEMYKKIFKLTGSSTWVRKLQWQFFFHFQEYWKIKVVLMRRGLQYNALVDQINISKVNSEPLNKNVWFNINFFELQLFCLPQEKTDKCYILPNGDLELSTKQEHFIYTVVYFKVCGRSRTPNE